MEKKIELSELELKVLHASVNRTFYPMTATPAEAKALCDVIDKANALMDELHADDELGDSLMEWYLAKYEAQQKAGRK